MYFCGYQHTTSGAWLNNDFQAPHFPTIDALIAACSARYPSRDAFAAEHGDPENWVKKEISMEEIRDIFQGEATA